MQDAVGVDVEGHLDLRLTPRCRADVLQLESTEYPVVLGQLPFTLQHNDIHCGLVAGRVAERLAARGGDGGVALDDLGHQPAGGLHTQRQWGDVEQQDVGDLALEHTGLDCGAERDHLIGVHAHVGVLAAGEPADQSLDCGDPGGTAHQDHLVDVVRAHLGVVHRLLDRAHAALHQIVREFLELRPINGQGEVLGAVGVGSDKRQVDLGLGHRRQFDLGLLGRLEKSLQRLRIFAQIDVVLALEFVGQVVDEPAVEVIATQVRITGRSTHFDHAVTDVKQAHVERAAAEVENQHGLVALLVQSVGQRRGRGLVDDAQHVEPGDPAGVLGGVALCVVEVRRNGDHRLLDTFTEELAGVVDEFAQDLCADLLRRVLLAAHVEPGGATLALDDVEADRLGFLRYLVETAADEPLRRVDGALRVHDRLSPGQLPDQRLAVFREGHHRWGRSRALGVGNHNRFPALPGGDHGVRCPEIYAYRCRHRLFLSVATSEELQRTVGHFNVGYDVVVLGQQSADGVEIAATALQRVHQQADQGADNGAKYQA